MTAQRPYSTGIGSLPYDDVDAAVSHVFANYTLPFLPQLPRRLAVSDMAAMLTEALTPQMLTALKNKDRVAFIAALSQAAAEADKAKNLVARWPGVSAGFRQAAARSPRLKMQLIGPASFMALCGMQLGTGALPVDAVCAWLSLLQVTAIKQLAATCNDIVWLWDDALLALPQYDNTRAHWFKRQPLPNVVEGMHCCAEVPFETLAGNLPVKLLAVDLNVVSISPEAITAFAASGRQLIAGIVDTRLAKVDQAAAFRLAAELPRSAVFAFSGGCGTGLHEIAFEKDVAATLRALSA